MKPLIQRLDAASDGTEILEPLAVIPNTPIMWPRAGKFKITFPLEKGDNVMLVFCERSIDNYQAGDPDADANPDDFRTHDLSDAVAIPGWYPDSKALGVATDADGIVVGNDDESMLIHITDSGIAFGEKFSAGSDQLTIESKVQAELSALQGSLDALVQMYNTHTHPVATAGSATAQTGTAAPTTALGTPPQPINPTASAILNVRE